MSVAPLKRRLRQWGNVCYCIISLSSFLLPIEAPLPQVGKLQPQTMLCSATGRLYIIDLDLRKKIASASQYRKKKKNWAKWAASDCWIYWESQSNKWNIYSALLYSKSTLYGTQLLLPTCYNAQRNCPNSQVVLLTMSRSARSAIQQ